MVKLCMLSCGRIFMQYYILLIDSGDKIINQYVESGSRYAMHSDLSSCYDEA